ncbi:tetratricopeptide repeat protein [Pelagicoccus sp. NFK12]|uniref:Tetratricopeptide repeat protein n=1 Tax=Pelagicoccus enzymogenes TaxID=2773457 RepID=A0A927IH49_9BACT|nr:tetratricopeptide repeat protein [Pelagicoccus enzymogenes]MBD5779353.1 tetratricopeptide repeat protein [Pelagicoccus enzymogenes]MDQ8198295.1 tetratricopeptide repeat protein [Pelagicoccus enzymogenes]
MICSKTIKLATTGILCLAGAASLSAQFKTDQEFWNQAHIRKTFEKSYEIRSKVEPDLTEEEQVLLKGVITMVTGDPATGIQPDKDKALRAILDALAANPDATAAFDFIAANFYAEKGDLKNAIKYYDSATKKFSSFLRAVRNGAIMKVKEGKYEAALKDFTKAIELGAKDTTTMGLLGLCYVNTGKYFSAETAYREAIVLDPTVKDWQVGLAKSLLQQRKYEEGIAVLEQILVDDPENDILWSSAANAYLGLEDAETAVAIQEIVDRLGKSTPESLVFMGNIYMSRSLNDLALEYFQRAIKMDPKQDPEVYVAVAETMTARGTYDQATKIISDIEKSFTNNLSDKDQLTLLRLEAQIGLATGGGEKVIPILEKLIERDPMDGQALLLLAEFNANKGTTDGYSRADLYFDRATKVRAWEVRALISWARSYVSRERFGKAIPLLERVQVIDPQDHIGRYLDQVRKVYIASQGL